MWFFKTPSRRTHDVVMGDTLQSLSLTYYGTDAWWRRIWEANQQTLKNPDGITPGMVLVIP